MNINRILKTALKGITACALTVLLFILIFVIYIAAHITNTKLTVSNYTVNADIDSPIRIVQLTDLHNAEFGDDNADLVSLVKEQFPDIIVMPGDMINRNDSDLTVICNLISDLSKIAPVYYGYGNHEYSWIERNGSNLEESLEDAGAIVFNNSYTEITVNGSEFCIGGFMGYYRQPGMMATGVEYQEEIQFFDEFEAVEDYKILLNHIPTSWLDWGYIDKYSVNLVFSGHYHGGQWVLPIIGAVYAPYVGFNPPYTKGVFEGTEATCVLSAGLGNERTWLPRVNNPAEIVVVELVPEN